MIILSTMDSNGLITIKSTDQMRFGWNFSEKSHSIHWLIIFLSRRLPFVPAYSDTKMVWNGGSLTYMADLKMACVAPFWQGFFIINVRPFKGYHWGSCFNCYNMSTLDAMSTTPGRRRRAEWDSSETEHREVTPDRSDQQLVTKNTKKLHWILFKFVEFT